LKVSSIARQLTAGTLTFILLFSSTPPALAHFAVGQVISDSFGFASVADVTSGILRRLTLTQDSSMPPSERPLPSPFEPRRPPTKGEREGKVHRVEVNPQGEVWLESGQPMNFTAVPLDLDGNAIHGLVAEWESSDRQVVFITRDGQAVAGKPGKAKLTVSIAHKKEKVDVTVIGGGKLRFGGRKDKGIAKSHDNRGARITSARWSPDEGGALFQTTRSARQAKFINTAAVYNDPYDLPDAESPSMYSPRNVVGTPLGKTTLGAATPATATNGTEMPGSSNFSFDAPVASIPGRGTDVSIRRLCCKNSLSAIIPLSRSLKLCYQVCS
jgi:hypothetical protein